MKAEAKIRGEEHHELDYHELKTIPPTEGKHRFAHCQILYEEVHAFLKKRKRAPVRVDLEVAGIIWIELFALNDITGNRSANGQHQPNPGATKRAEKKEGKRRGVLDPRSNISARPP